MDVETEKTVFDRCPIDLVRVLERTGDVHTVVGAKAKENSEGFVWVRACWCNRCAVAPV